MHMIRSMPALVSVAIVGLPQAVWAAGFDQITYQGRLELDGISQNGEFDFAFAIENADEDRLWFEVHTVVPVYAGRFSVALGSSTAFPDDLWETEDLYLRLEVRRAGQAAFIPLIGRQQLSSVPHAKNAGASETQHGRHDRVSRTAPTNYGEEPLVGTTSWEITTTRYRLTTDPSFEYELYPIPHDIVVAYCGDEDGCRLTLGAVSYSYDLERDVVSSVDRSFYYDPSTGAFSLLGGASDSGTIRKGQDGDGSVSDIFNMGACAFTDSDAHGAADASMQLFFGSPASNSGDECFVIFED